MYMEEQHDPNAQPKSLEEVLIEFGETFPDLIAPIQDMRAKQVNENLIRHHAQSLLDLKAKQKRGEEEEGDMDLIREHREEIWRLQAEQ